MCPKMRTVYVPSAVSSFFTFEGVGEDGSFIQPLQRVGAKGGGFKLVKGTHTSAELIESPEDEVLFDGRPIANSTTHAVLNIVRRRTGSKGHFRVTHWVEVPIGAGFGTSASASIGAAVAVLREIDFKGTFRLAGEIAHEADLVSHTGLGTVGAIYASAGTGGLIVEPGGPGVCRVEAFMEDFEKLSLIAVTFKSREKRPLLTSSDIIKRVNEVGTRTLERVMSNPSSVVMLRESRKFAVDAGLATPELDKVCSLMEEAGALASAHNMIGEAAHCIAWRDDARHVTKRLIESYPAARLTVSKMTESSFKVQETP